MKKNAGYNLERLFHILLDKLLTKWKYVKKLKLYIKNGKLPSYKRIISILRQKNKIKWGKHE
jgi:hypothetical protein